MSPPREHPDADPKGRGDESPAARRHASRTVAPNSHDRFTLKQAHVWDVELPLPSDSPKRFVPSPIQNHERRGKVSVEVHRISPPDGPDETVGDRGSEGPAEAEQCIVRILKPPKSKKIINGHLGHKIDFLSYGAADTDDTDDDDMSVSTAGTHLSLPEADDHRFPIEPGTEANRVPWFDIAEEDGGGSNSLPDLGEWATKYELPLTSVTIDGRAGSTVKVSIGDATSPQQRREFVFGGEPEASAFCELVSLLKSAQSAREREALAVAMGGAEVEEEEKIDLLIDIVSCWDLPAADLKTSDPFVVVRLGDKEVHRTKFVPSILNPIYTIKTDSLFILSLPVKRPFEFVKGITFEVIDYNAIGKSESLGAAMVPPKMLYESNGERLEFKLKPLVGEKNYGKGMIAIRCRHATQYDKEVMSALREGRSLEVEDECVYCVDGVRGGFKSIVTKDTKKGRLSLHEKEVKYRMRPGPHPERKDSTKWLTKEQIHDEAMKESERWIEAGSGKLGRIFLEVIGCDDLPNLELFGCLGKKTDAFVNIVHEDSVVRTDVIADCLSPRWPPWSQRAFIFHMMHSSSQVFLAVADYDSGVDDHDVIGRVAFDISKLRPGTEYFLHYKIFDAEDINTRKPRGSIYIRIMIEVKDERQLVLNNLAIPPPLYVNATKRKDFRILQYTCTGKCGKEGYGLKQINAYIEELLTYYHILCYYIRESLINVLLWRGHFPLSISLPGLSVPERHNHLEGETKRKLSVLIPLNSIIAFAVATILVEHPRLLPSFFFALIGWSSTAVLGFLRKNPSPWVRCKPFSEYVRNLVFGTSSPPCLIAANENAKESEAFVKKWEERIASFEEAAKKQNEERLRREEEHQKELAEIGEMDIDISTQAGSRGLSLDPLKAIWVPIQEALANIVLCVRFTRSVLIWEECYLAFILCASSYALAVVFFFVPWAFLIRWSLRILVWGLLGPWMKLVDLFWDSKIKPAVERMKKVSLQKRQESIIRLARIERENAAKLKEFKQLMFGRYLAKVPIFKTDKYRDIPLPDSTAKPVAEPELRIREATKKSTRLTGQHLVGEMVPVPKMNVTPDAATEVLHPKLGPNKVDREEEFPEHTPLRTSSSQMNTGNNN